MLQPKPSELKGKDAGKDPLTLGKSYANPEPMINNVTEEVESVEEPETINESVEPEVSKDEVEPTVSEDTTEPQEPTTTAENTETADQTAETEQPKDE